MGENQYQPVRSNAGRRDHRADIGGGRAMVIVVAVTMVLSGVAYLCVVGRNWERWPDTFAYENQQEKSWKMPFNGIVDLQTSFSLHNQLERNIRER